MVTVDFNKRQALPRGTASRRRSRRPAPRRHLRLIDLNGAKLYAIMSYRLAMTIIIVITVLELGRQGS